eukprot:TRINITY_DN808_c0_g1_i3.p1 TRINITY_DN808_c0_g1~~TRINITY_DN808_c0_g1_i3.p1  ORF type:complete len:231 (-),score=63.20 TRINITY_DN808_c0_g1_i3:63-755(-)
MKEKPLNDFYSFDIETNTWTEIISQSDVVPPKRSFHKMVSWDNTLYLFGGCGEEGRLKDLFSFDVSTNKWTELASVQDISKGRGGPSIATNGKSLILAGGFSGEENDDVHLFDFSNQTWNKISSGKFSARSVAPSCRISKDLMAIFGGEVHPSNKSHEGAGDFANDTFFIGFNDGSVIEATNTGVDVPNARGWTSMIGLEENSALLFGGLNGDDENPQRLNDSWLLTISN